MDPLARWRDRRSWRIPGLIAFVNATRIDPNDVTHRLLLGDGFELIATPLLDSEGRVTPHAAEAEVIVGGQRLGRDIFAQLRRCRLLLRPYVGYDDIDIAAATAEGILVANVPDAFIEEVANHAMALILAANRKLLQADRYVRSGEWAARRGRPAWLRPIHRLSGLTLGFVGFGNIARLVAERARAFSFRMLAYDPYAPAEAGEPYGVQLVPLEQVLREADIVTVHTLLSPETHHLLNAERLALMKPGAYLVNTSRGPVVDEQALVAALQSGRLAGAALDVMEVEPLPPDSPLCRLDNVILTPHIAAYSEEGQLRARQRIAEIVRPVALGRLPERKVVVNKDLYDQIAALLGA